MKKLLLLAALLAFPALAQDASTTSFWAIQHQPAAATAATISQAADTNGRHVARFITICLSAVAAQTTLVYNLRDGASGAGTIVWSARLAGTAGAGHCITAEVRIIGTKNTAMTLESAAAPAATNFATVSLNGYTSY